ncbi:hypothetical protein OE766_09635 [Pararhizobium sp. YC-54]|uniref:hypothetical protein n=1 Tax=Pararhizobium sp. YC-54 TaxID=2986920 RepID=UPI0021F6CB6A|nr:hypothetical protein [Pararhizobium sp. YC-54]MCV9998508.1 hypothetical protein [Pararhizobium sp. YC-54]
MKFFATCLLTVLSMTNQVLADGAPPPRLPMAEGDKKPVTVPETKSFGRQEAFVLPSGNIGCIYTPEGGTKVYQPADGGPELSCDRIEPRYVRATLPRKGDATLVKDVGDQSCCPAGPVLDYGQTWTAGPFSCLSTRTGLSCERNDGHSFFLSRKRLAAN